MERRRGAGKERLGGDEDGVEARGVDHAVFDGAGRGAGIDEYWESVMLVQYGGE